jgi:pimeloyl-ACP methyl ester carboxylesterase
VHVDSSPGLKTIAPLGASERSLSHERTAAEESEALAWLARRRLTANLAWRIYGRDVKSWGENEVDRGHFVDDELDLRAGGTVLDGVAYVSFRGTVGLFGLSSNWLNVNLRSRLTAEAPRRHSGFDRAWRALRPQVLQWLESVRPTALVLTGHSMGAALALLAAHDLCREWPVRGVHVFAPPMVGTAEFNSDLLARLSADGQVVDLMGYLMRTDAISIRLPRLVGYVEAPNVVRVDERGFPDDLGQGRPAEFIGTFAGPFAASNLPVPASALAARPTPGEMDRNVLGALQSSVVASSHWGWLAFAGLCLVSVLRRAVSYHAMDGYAVAFGALTPHVASQPKWTSQP